MTMVGSILILSEQPVIAALVGMLVELTGAMPAFANPAEQAADALQRVRPLAVILIDAEMTTARSDLFFALAARKDIRVAVFGSDARAREIAEVAARRRIPWLTLPPNVERLSMVLGLTDGERAGTRQQQRRQPAESIVAADGTCILRDAGGRHWMVYDRRQSGERRSSESESAADATDRVFVAEDGETRCYALSEAGVAGSETSVLEEQLARAT
jgi:hypothetical protein